MSSFFLASLRSQAFTVKSFSCSDSPKILGLTIYYDFWEYAWIVLSDALDIIEGAEGKIGGPPFFKDTLAPKFDLWFKLVLY